MLKKDAKSRISLDEILSLSFIQNSLSSVISMLPVLSVSPQRLSSSSSLKNSNSTPQKFRFNKFQNLNSSSHPSETSTPKIISQNSSLYSETEITKRTTQTSSPLRYRFSNSSSKKTYRKSPIYLSICSPYYHYSSPSSKQAPNQSFCRSNSSFTQTPDQDFRRSNPSSKYAPDEYYRLATKYLNGESVSHDLRKAEHYFLRAIQRNHASAMFSYANSLHLGIFGTEKIPLSEKYYLMAIEHNDEDSVCGYANALREGIYGEEKIQFSEKYYLMGIEHNDIQSLYNYSTALQREI
jgi:hypothetical protein